MIKDIKSGIHTIELYLREMSYDKGQDIVDDLKEYQKEIGRKVIRKTWQAKNGINRRHRVIDSIVPEGIIMQIEQIDPIGGIRFIVNPSTLENQVYDPIALYEPKESTTLIQDALVAIKDEFTDSKNYGIFNHKEWYYKTDKITLSRIDLTWNLHFDENVKLTEVIRLFHHANIENYTQESFNDREKDKHSFTIRKGPVTFTVYDKNYETENHKKIDTDYTDNILRIEIKVERDGFQSNFKLKKKTEEYTYDELLRYAYENKYDILHKYLNKLFPNEGEHLPYQKADVKIKKEVSPQFQNAMLYLIKETSRLKNYTRAKEATMKKYELGRKKYKYLLDEFERINLSPITLKKDAKTKRVPCFKTLVFECLWLTKV